MVLIYNNGKKNNCLVNLQSSHNYLIFKNYVQIVHKYDLFQKLFNFIFI